MPMNLEQLQARSSSRGMTLVELVLALTILAMISAVLFGAIGFGGKVQQTVAANSEAHATIVSTHRFLRTQLSNAVSPMQLTSGLVTPDLSADSGNHPFHGRPNRLLFTAPWLTYIGQGELFVFELLEQSGNLVVTWHPARSDYRQTESDNTEIVSSRVLLEAISDFSIEYFGRGDETAEMKWHDSWTNGSNLPYMLRINVNLSDGPSRIWPEFLVELAS